MEPILYLVVLFFAGYGANALKHSLTDYFDGLRDGVDRLNDNNEQQSDMQNRMVDALETMVQHQQQNRNSDNVVEMRTHRRTGTDNEPAVEFHDETPTEYNREG